MLLGGLWHGANWTFVVWGALHGGASIGGAGRQAALGRAWSHRPAAVARQGRCSGVLTFDVVCFAWVFFRAPSFHTAFEVLGGLFTAGGTRPRSSRRCSIAHDRGHAARRSSCPERSAARRRSVLASWRRCCRSAARRRPRRSSTPSAPRASPPSSTSSSGRVWSEMTVRHRTSRASRHRDPDSHPANRWSPVAAQEPEPDHRWSRCEAAQPAHARGHRARRRGAHARRRRLPQLRDAARHGRTTAVRVAAHDRGHLARPCTPSVSGRGSRSQARRSTRRAGNSGSADCSTRRHRPRCRPRRGRSAHECGWRTDVGGEPRPTRRRAHRRPPQHRLPSRRCTPTGRTLEIWIGGDSIASEVGQSLVRPSASPASSRRRSMPDRRA